MIETIEIVPLEYRNHSTLLREEQTIMKRLHMLSTINNEPEITTSHALFDFAIGFNADDIQPNIEQSVIQMQNLHLVPFASFIRIHKLCPKIYMLQIDRDIDTRQTPQVKLCNASSEIRQNLMLNA